MNAIAKRKSELQRYEAPVSLDAETVDAFWNAKLAESREVPLQAVRVQEHSLFPTVRVDKLIYAGHDGTPIHGWFLVPTHAGESKRPCILTFPGYTGDKGLPERYAQWLMLGYAVLAIDARGQTGETGNLLPDLTGAAPGWVSTNIMDKDRCYYLELALDVVRAAEIAAQQPEVDTNRIASMGSSQGGGMALLAGALSPHIRAVVANIPNMCHMDFGVLNSTGSLTEIARYVKRYPDKLEDVLATLAHFDIVNLAHRITAPVLMAVSWKDTVCMPETVYGAYNRLSCSKRIYDYPFNGHETGEEHQRKVMLFVQEIFAE
ncbi:acetylxylan esterase [Paenibacillus whitsoniae]|uniref:Acetylesterase n=1 Tax=Paenibacillus whitsoniae TaxID=2496558 RepID=A0A3S0A015_9BACL|nr:acetylxylan esterase [Paenibacillus whitsoniae]RTE02996.1 acetylesterase [Paenibacillus whitsoniae]